MPATAVEVVKLVSMWFFFFLFYSRSFIGDSIQWANMNWFSRTHSAHTAHNGLTFSVLRVCARVFLLLFGSLFVLKRSCTETKIYNLHIWRVQSRGRNRRWDTKRWYRVVWLRVKDWCDNDDLTDGGLTKLTRIQIVVAKWIEIGTKREESISRHKNQPCLIGRERAGRR